jgi:hypothetical protein
MFHGSLHDDAIEQDGAMCFTTTLGSAPPRLVETQGAYFQSNGDREDA